MAVKYITKDLYAISGGQHSTALRHTFEYDSGIFTKWGGELQITKKVGSTTVVSINSGRFLIQGRFLENSIVEDVEVTGLTALDKTFYLVIDIDLGIVADPTFKILSAPPTILEDLTESDTAKRQETLATIVANSVDGIKTITNVIKKFSIAKNDVYLKVDGTNRMKATANQLWEPLANGTNFFIGQANGSGSAAGSTFAQIGLANPTDPLKRCYLNVFDGKSPNAPFNRPHMTIQNAKVGYNQAQNEPAIKGDLYNSTGGNTFVYNKPIDLDNSDVLFENTSGINADGVTRTFTLNSNSYRKLYFIFKPANQPSFNLPCEILTQNFLNGTSYVKIRGTDTIGAESSTTERVDLEHQTFVNGTSFRYIKGSFIQLRYQTVGQNIILSQRDSLKLYKIIGIR